VSVTVDVVSIGSLSRNRFWSEQGPVRPAHATTSLIRVGGTAILVDPALPGELLAQRLDERTGLKPEQIDIVFLTSFRPVHRRGLPIFTRADWLMLDTEIQAVWQHLEALEGGSDPLIAEEAVILERIKPAPDRLAPSVDLFPTPGVTPGACGLLVLFPNQTFAVAGDAVISRDYLEHGRVFEQCVDADAAKESFVEIIEIADVVIPGHDNIVHR